MASIDYLLSIWPIATSLATHTPAGDLISLSRTSHRLRQITHNHPNLELGLGLDSSYWYSLKQVAPFTCCDPSHKPPKTEPRVRPCKFCSRPVCKACIVREFFQNPNPKYTYKSRTRYFCQKCWTNGNLRKDFRYHYTSREHIWHGRHYAQRGGTCSCSASEDNWLCGPCRNWQASGFTFNQSLFDAEWSPSNDTQAEKIRCYGLDCDELITESDRDRRRVCLWCSKPLARQYGGEDRLRWEDKQISIRAAHAAARSADINEWARTRFQNLTMSRRGMRGTQACIQLTGSDGPEHDRPIFVRHLDAVNYRRFMVGNQEPTGPQVYDSKQGRWTYSREFLKRANYEEYSSRRQTSMSFADHANRDSYAAITRENGLKFARTNYDAFQALNVSSLNRSSKKILQWSSHLIEAGLMDVKDREKTWKHYKNIDMAAVWNDLWDQLEHWYDLDDVAKPSCWAPTTLFVLLRRHRKPDSVLNTAVAEREPPPKFAEIDRQVDTNSVVVGTNLPILLENSANNMDSPSDSSEMSDNEELEDTYDRHIHPR